ncbi:MAG: cation:proton antiporter [Verrucomicrobiota bacterium]
MAGLLSLLATSSTDVSPIVAVLTVLLVSVVLVSLVLARFRQSLLVGYFLCGVVIANSGLLEMLGATAEEGVIERLAELGVVLLMFTLGIEFSLEELKHLRKVVFGGGSLQMAATSLAIGLVAHAFGADPALAFVIGMTLAVSSTAVSLKSFQDMGMPTSPGARMALGISIFQDLLVILFMIFLPPILGASSGSPVMAVGGAMAKAALFLLGTWVLSRYVIPKLLDAVAGTRSRELFTITVVALCATIAFGASQLQLSLALGAFAAGLVVSESIYSHRVLADILPFKDLFLTLFFVSVGLLIDVSTTLANWGYVTLGVIALLLIKGLIVWGLARWLRLNTRQSLLGAFALASSGEFSLVLLSRVGELRVLDPQLEQILLVCTAVSMGLVPALMRWATPLSRALEGQKFFRSRPILHPELESHAALKRLQEHVIICGYGPVGRSLHRALTRCDIPVLVIELNAETVRTLHHQGVPVLFADATHPETMELARVQAARAIAFTFPEAEITLQSLALVRAQNPQIYAFARAKFRSQVSLLQKEGVQAVIHDEHESAHRMIHSVLGSYGRGDVEEALKAAFDDWV